MEGIPTMTEQIIRQEARYIVHTYNRPPFVLVHGEGMTLYDSEGNAYTDWVSGIAVSALGYGDAGLQEIIAQQLNHGMIHVSNLYHTAPHVELAKALVESSFADRVYFCNSGAEANEAAIKFARKTAYKKGKTSKIEFVAFTGGFHGRTIGALALTPRENYQKPFAPLMPGVQYAEFNNIESAETAINAQTAAVIVEPVQGEGGVNLADADFLKALRELCDEHDVALIFDEVQCGVGRTGKLWGYEHSGVKPDIMTLAKPLAGGLPIGAVLATEAIASHIEPGDHGSTFAAGPMVTGAARYVLEQVNQPGFLNQVAEVGDYLLERLEEINSPYIKDVRGQGLIAAMELTVPAAPLVSEGYKQGLILVTAGANVLRFVPPLIVEKQHVDQLVEKLTTMLASINTEA